MVCTFPGTVIEASCLQFLRRLDSRSVIPEGIWKDSRQAQSANAPLPILTRLPGRVTEVRFLHCLNASGRIFSTPS